MNGCPVRMLFLRTKESKERLRSALAPANVQKTMAAPVTVIVANDMKFYYKLPKLMPHNPNAGSFFEKQPGVGGSHSEVQRDASGRIFHARGPCVGPGLRAHGDPGRPAPAFAAAGFRRSLQAAVKAAHSYVRHTPRPITCLDSAHPIHNGRITGLSEGGGNLTCNAFEVPCAILGVSSATQNNSRTRQVAC